VMKKSDYLLFSWHPDTRPAELDLKDETIKWVGLAIGECQQGGENDEEGTVSFTARYKVGGRAAKLVETSRFRRHKGWWKYLDGEVAE
jgi:SEC-C motif domain protein